VLLAKVEGDPDQVTVPVYPVPAVTVVTGVAPVTGAVTPAIAVAAMVVAVAGKRAVMTPELAELVALVAPAIVNWLAETPVKVYPAVAVKVMVAV
jgi:hypothetical protein